MPKTLNRYFNPNPKKREDVGDCVVRALVKVTDSDWDTVFKGLCEIAFEQKAMPNTGTVWKEYLMRNGFEYKKFPKVKKGQKRPTPQTFAKANKEGAFVLKMAKHICACKDGLYFDTWDCGESAVYGYWEKVN